MTSGDRTVEAWLDEPAPWRQTRRLGRALSVVESGDEDLSLSRAVCRRAGRAVTVGLTGAPGVGKSTLTAALARELRRRGSTVAVLAFDPTSPMTGGAVLGDRVRMADLETDTGVFIRSMASRGGRGGLARAAAAATDLLDAAGFPWILVETVGAGQAQTAIHQSADVVVLVNAPGLGDGVQAIKGGTMEIADIFVVNKGDLPGAGAAQRAIRELLPPPRDAGQEPAPVLLTTARTGDGAPELVDALSACFERLRASGGVAARRAVRLRRRVLDLYRTEVLRLAMGAVDEVRLAGDLASAAAALDVDPESQQNPAPGAADPWDVADRLVGRFISELPLHGGTES